MLFPGATVSRVWPLMIIGCSIGAGTSDRFCIASVTSSVAVLEVAECANVVSIINPNKNMIREMGMGRILCKYVSYADWIKLY